MTNQDRQELFDLYSDLCEKYQELQEIMRDIGGHEYEVARAYWLGSIESGLRCEEYVGHNQTFRTFLQDSGIIDEDEEFIEEDGNDEE